MSAPGKFRLEVTDKAGEVRVMLFGTRIALANEIHSVAFRFAQTLPERAQIRELRITWEPLQKEDGQ